MGFCKKITDQSLSSIGTSELAGENINSSYLNKIFDKNRHIQKLLNKDVNKKTASDVMNTRMIESCIHLPKYD